MKNRNRHPNKEIEAAVQYAEEQQWTYKSPGNSAHAWGRLYCPLREREGCILSIWSTPRDPDVHAKTNY